MVRSSDQVSGDHTAQVSGEHGHSAQVSTVHCLCRYQHCNCNAAAVTSSVMDNLAGSEIVPHLEQIDVSVSSVIHDKIVIARSSAAISDSLL